MSYKHLTLSERGKLEGFLALKMGIREIALLMGRHPSTITREIRRNSFMKIIRQIKLKLCQVNEQRQLQQGQNYHKNLLRS